MTDEQFAEMYAINLFNQEQARLAWNNEERSTWDELTKKQRDNYRKTANKILEEIE